MRWVQRGQRGQVTLVHLIRRNKIGIGTLLAAARCTRSMIRQKCHPFGQSVGGRQEAAVILDRQIRRWWLIKTAGRMNWIASSEYYLVIATALASSWLDSIKLAAG